MANEQPRDVRELSSTFCRFHGFFQLPEGKASFVCGRFESATREPSCIEHSVACQNLFSVLLPKFEKRSVPATFPSPFWWTLVQTSSLVLALCCRDGSQGLLSEIFRTTHRGGNASFTRIEFFLGLSEHWSVCSTKRGWTSILAVQ